MPSVIGTLHIYPHFLKISLSFRSPLSRIFCAMKVGSQVATLHISKFSCKFTVYKEMVSHFSCNSSFSCWYLKLKYALIVEYVTSGIWNVAKVGRSTIFHNYLFVFKKCLTKVFFFVSFLSFMYWLCWVFIAVWTFSCCQGQSLL